MALEKISRLIRFAVLLALCAAALPMPAFASAPAVETLKVHRLKFYLDPLLVPDLEFARGSLAKYVEDMNFVLAKNTSRRLLFDPATDIILTSSQPHSNWAVPPLPLEDFEIWAHVVHTDFPISHGGYAGLDDSGAGVLAGLKWTRLYDPDLLTSAEVADYWTQVNNMLHELAHVFGAGMGEYYNLMTIQDMTAVTPALDIDIYAEDDPFWSDKPDFKTDPLLWNLARASSAEPAFDRSQLLARVQFSALTAAILSGDDRNGAPTVDLEHIHVRVVTADGQSIAGANVKAWSVVGGAPFETALLSDGLTTEGGDFSFAWGGAANPHNSRDFLRLVKVYKDGYVPSARYVSIFDADIVKLVNGGETLDLTIQMDEVPSVSSFADVPTSHFAWAFIERLYAAGITGGCADEPLRYCPQQVVTRAQMAVLIERGWKGATFTPPSAPASFGDTLSHWAQDWIEAFAADGLTGGCGVGKYCPEAPVDRAQMAVFLLKALHGAAYTPPPAAGTVFLDVSAEHWAAAWIEQLAVEGISSGCGNGKYCPEAPVTRAQMSVFLVKTFALP